MNEWISVNDRLPEKDVLRQGIFLVRVQEIYGGFLRDSFKTEVAKYSETMMFPNYFDIKTPGMVTHWMPLPEPPTN